MAILSLKRGLRVLALLQPFTHVGNAFPAEARNALHLLSRQGPIPPDLNSFYAAPAGLIDSKPGDILRSRPVPYPSPHSTQQLSP